jgi:tetratricopeptide (TPR) repeat protein
VHRHITAAASFMSAKPAVFLSFVISVFIGAAFLFRVAAPLLGDSFFLARNFSESFRGQADLYYRNEPLSTYFFSSFMKTFGVKTYAEFLDAFLYAEIFLAIPTIIFLFMTVRQLFTDARDQLLAFFFLLVFPGMQLFFGYVEIYAFVLCFSALYILTATLYLNGNIRFSLVACSFIVMVCSHFGTLLLFPSLCYLGYLDRKRQGYKDILIGTGIIVAVIILAAFATGFDPNRFSAWVPHSHFLSLTEKMSEADRNTSAFTLFSLFHAIDVINLFILMAPCVVAIILYAVVRERNSITTSPTHRFFVTAVAPGFGLLWVIKYDLGGARDWDVFSFLFLILFLFSAIVVFSSEHPDKRKALALISGITMLHSILFFSVNAGKESGEARYKALFDKRMFSQAAFYNGSLYLAQYYHQIKNTTEPLKVWEYYVSEFPGDERGYGNIYTNMTSQDSLTDEQKFALLERWNTEFPSSSTARTTYAAFLSEAGSRYFQQGKLVFAERLFRKAVVLRPGSAEAHNNLGSVIAEEGNLDEAASYFSRAITLNPNFADAYFNLANTYIDRGRKKEGIEYLRRAEELGNRHAAEALQNYQR